MSIPGRILYVNLSDGSSKVEPIDTTLSRDFIGGYGINNKLAYDLIPPGTAPLSPENLIIIGALLNILFDKTGSYKSGWIMNAVFLLIISLLILALKPNPKEG